MSKTTTNYGLIKPERSDNYSVDVMANNMDIIDAMVAPKTETDAMKEKLDNIEIDEEGSIVFDTKIKLNNVITVTPSTNNPMRIRASVNILPYVLGATYTGTIRIKSGSGSTLIVYFMSSSGVMSSESIAASVDKTITIPDNTIYAYVDHDANYASSYSTYYAPLFS